MFAMPLCQEKEKKPAHAIKQVVGKRKEAISGVRWKHGRKKYCLFTALDVENAFNSARWKNIYQVLVRLDIPTYLKKMIKRCLKNRLLMYDIEEGPYQITGGVPQGSVSGPPLWKIIYNDMLKIKLPPGAEIEAFTDDAGLVITGNTLEEIQRIFGECYEAVQQSMGSVGLKLSDKKTEAVLFTSRKQVENIIREVGQCTITYRPCIRYLVLMLDARVSFKPHVEHAAVKAATVATELARLMPNIGRPRQPRWKLLASVVTSIPTYEIAIYGEALKIKDCRRKIRRQTEGRSQPSQRPQGIPRFPHGI